MRVRKWVNRVAGRRSLPGQSRHGSASARREVPVPAVSTANVTGASQTREPLAHAIAIALRVRQCRSDLADCKFRIGPSELGKALACLLLLAGQGKDR